jgi:hypothetical protein
VTRARRTAGGAALLAVAVVVAVASPASAEVRADLGDRAAIDWTRGILSAVGAAAGDVRAPSPAIARGGAERQAREAARARLAELARGLPLAAGGTVGEALDKDPAAAARLAAALSRSLDVEVDYSSDGSVVLRAGLPVEAIRLALAGAPRAPDAHADGSPTALVVDARKLPARPAVGAELAWGKERFAAPVVYHLSPEKALADPRVGDRAVRVEAIGLDRGVIQVPDDVRLAAARRAGALVVVLVSRQ